MSRIIFVDDDQNVLQGIRRMLRPMRDKWTLTFASSGQEALHLLKDKPYDAIVSDTRMPGMNGIELLNQIRELYPNMIRIGLSGHTDEDLALQSSKTTHQQLVKPCKPETLKETIDKALHMCREIKNESLHKFITEVDSLPALPKLYKQVTDIMQSDNGSLIQVADVIAKDIAISAKILQLVNSAFFGLTRHVKSVQDAVTYLGFDVIRGLVLTIRLFDEFNPSTQCKLNLEALWERSFKVSSIAKYIAEQLKLDSKSQDYAQMSGMLNDIGMLLMAMNSPKQYGEILELQRLEKQPLDIIERKTFGCTHAEVGAALLGIWGLPEPIIDAVMYHHNPLQSQQKDISPLTAVYLANVYYDQNVQSDYVVPIQDEYIETLGLTETLKPWETSIKDRFFTGEQP